MGYVFYLDGDVGGEVRVYLGVVLENFLLKVDYFKYESKSIEDGKGK